MSNTLTVIGPNTIITYVDMREISNTPALSCSLNIQLKFVVINMKYPLKHISINHFQSYMNPKTDMNVILNSTISSTASIKVVNVLN